MKRNFVWLALFLSLAVVAGAQEAEHECPISWIGRTAEIEDFLTSAEVVSVEKIGMGVTDPSKVVLRKDGQELAAAFKPIERGRQKGFWESYEAEIAAYEFDKMLGLNMVPPTVKRTVDKETGSLQLWVEDSVLYRDVEGQKPSRPADWSRQLSRMKMFDVLMMNNDRNAQNFMVDEAWHVVLIDHSRAFLPGKNIQKVPTGLPVQFDRQLVEKLKALDKEALDQEFKGLLMGGQVKSILLRRDALLEYMDGLIAERGEARVLFN